MNAYEGYWTNLSSSDFEHLVGILLSRTHKSRRVDGGGGDGGRDSHFHDESGYHIYQTKAFLSGRLANGGRRKQITRSFDAARKFQPDTWTLILGIDATPSEEAWLDNLGTGTEIKVRWHGRTWLEDQLALFPDIVRYFTENASRQLLRELGNLERMERAGLQGGVTDVFQRMSDFSAQVDELSPHYRFDLKASGGKMSVALQPKYDGAEEDAPLAFELRVDSPNPEAFLRGFSRLGQFGAPLDMEGPDASDVLVTPSPLLGDPFRPDRILISPITSTAPSRRIRAVVVGATGAAVAEQDLEITRSGRGTRGLFLRAENRLGTLTVEIDLDTTTKRLDLHFHPDVTHGVSPSEMAHVFGWIEELSNGLELQVWDVDTGLILFSGKPNATEDSPFRGSRRVLEDLARLQAHSGVDFPVPSDITKTDVYWIARGIELLDSGETEVDWGALEITVTFSNGFNPLPPGDCQMALDGADIRVPIAGHDLLLGQGRIHLPEVVVVNREELQAMQPGDTATVRLIPGSNQQNYRMLLFSAIVEDERAEAS